MFLVIQGGSGPDLASSTSVAHARLVAGSRVCGWTRGWSSRRGSVHGQPEQGGRRLGVGGVACVHGAALGFLCIGRPVRLDRFGGFGRTRSIEYAGSLSSLGLNGSGDDPVDFMPIDGEDLSAPVVAVAP
ncbi:hypothetical protein F511_30446 [Dorcoceras hygrometricum]|uniref:Uncharacterized protein n=1 Tax=Dorcoceras hygrometricum TaxID=472368 RepID=A0A2Z7CA44_9LAMI|nr:hypothetical protein F511_30446 [Dorcoceras hygrometricum]